MAWLTHLEEDTREHDVRAGCGVVVPLECERRLCAPNRLDNQRGYIRREESEIWWKDMSNHEYMHRTGEYRIHEMEEARMDKRTSS